MKMTIKYIAALFAAGALLASCSDEAFENQNISNPQSEGTRVIAVSFGQQTRTALGDDGLTPEFVGGESVLVSNDEAIEYCTVTISGERASITTSLKGDLTAVYPASAAKVIKSEKTKGNIIDPDNVNILSIQSGTFADANICMAQMKDGEEKLTFHNKTALFRITPKAEEISYLEVSTEVGDIANSAPTGDTDLKTIRVNVPATDKPDEYFVSILVPSGLKASNLTFSDGTNVKTVTGDKASTDIAVGTLYTVTKDGWESPAPAAPEGFVDLGVKDADGNPVYWAEKNLGANKPQDYGTYFSWGDVTGQTPKSNVFGKAFSWDNDVFGETFDKVAQATACPNDVLAQTYDVAYQTNNAWRMPTREDFTELAKECFLEWTASYNNTGVTGLIVWKAKDGDAGWFKPSTAGMGRKIKNDGSEYNDAETHTFSNTYVISTDPYVFFPAAGHGNNANHLGAGSYGNYWSSSLYTTKTSKAYVPSFSVDYVSLGGYNIRCYGYPVRPVSN